MKHIPNILSSLRIVLTGVFAWLFLRALGRESVSFWWPIGIYALAFLTDVFDGFLARTFHWITPLGKILDPIADKLMAITALICILVGKQTMQSHATLYIVLFMLVAVKECLMLIGGAMLLKKHRVAYADWYGKSATGVFTAGVVLTLLSFALPSIEPWNIAVLSAAVAMSYFAMAHYAKTQLFSEKPQTEATPDEEKLFEKVDRLTHSPHTDEQKTK